MQVLITVLAIFFTLAVERSIYRLYWDFKTEKEKRDYLGTIFLTLCTISVIVLVLLFLSKSIVGLLYKAIPFYPYYAFAILIAFFAVFQQVPKIYLQLQQKPGSFVAISILQFTFSTAMIIWYVVGLKSGAEGMLKGQVIGGALMLPLFLFLSLKMINISFKPEIFKESLKFSIPMIPMALSSWALNLSDRIFIERYFSLADVGIYSLGYKIAGLSMIVGSAFNVAYEPIFFKLANSDDQIVAKKQLFFYNNTYVMVALLICFLISLFAKEAIVLLLDERYSNAYKIVPIIILAFFISDAGGLMNRSIYQEKKTMAMMLIVASASLLSIALNFILVPIFGVYGAACTVLFSYTGMSFIEYWYAKRCYFIDYDWNMIIKGLSLAVIMISLFYIIDMNIYLSLFIKLIITIGVLLYLYTRFSDEIKLMSGGVIGK